MSWVAVTATQNTSVMATKAVVVAQSPKNTKRQTMPASAAAKRKNAKPKSSMRLSSRPQVVGAPHDPASDCSTIQSFTWYARSMMTTICSTAKSAATPRAIQT